MLIIGSMSMYFAKVLNDILRLETQWSWCQRQQLITKHKRGNLKKNGGTKQSKQVKGEAAESSQYNGFVVLQNCHNHYKFVKLN